MKETTSKLLYHIDNTRKEKNEMNNKYSIYLNVIILSIIASTLLITRNVSAQGTVAFWEHGNIVEAEDPVLSMKRWGWGTTIEQNFSYNWFHFNISTPVLLDGVRSPLKKIFVFFDASPSTTITQIDVWDGATRIKIIDNLSITGNHSNAIDQFNSWIIDPNITINYGLSFSVRVAFGDDGEITFTTVGADFQKP